MKTTPVIFALLLAILVLAGGCGRPSSPPEAKEKSDDVSKKSPTEAGLAISTEAQRRSGIVATPLESAQWIEGIEAAGRVADPGPFIQMVFDLVAARATGEASARELERNQKLNTLQENVSRHVVETAEATARRDALAVEIAAQKIMAVWGTTLAERSDLSEFAHRLGRHEAALIRLEVAPGQSLLQAPASIVITLPGDGKTSWPAEFMGFSAAADSQTQGQGIVALIPSHPPTVGLMVLAKIGTGASPRDGVRVPHAAVVRFGDGQFVYVQKAPELFERRAIHPTASIGSDFFVSSDLAAGEKVAVEGAQQLLSEELKGSTPAD